MRYVIYSNADEMFCCVLADERKLIAEFFEKSIGRNIDDYDRIETLDFPFVKSALRLS